METVSETKQFGGTQGVYKHASEATCTEMTFAMFLPPQAAVGSESGRVPVLWYLSGLTCTHANVMDKGQYQRAAARHGIAVVCPDTSPRGADVPDVDDWREGQGAGFYVDATEAPWSKNYRMATYVMDELTALVADQFPLDMARQGVTGHSMGGHGALVHALRAPERFRSVSAFAPIASAAQAEWSRGALATYLGDDEAAWSAWDATALVRAGGRDGKRVPSVLIDQGAADPFLRDGTMPHLFAEACEEAGIECVLRMQAGYDHGYGFVSTFMDDHMAWHAARLGA